MEKMGKKKEERRKNAGVTNNPTKENATLCVQYVSWKVYMHLTIRKIKLLV